MRLDLSAVQTTLNTTGLWIRMIAKESGKGRQAKLDDRRKSRQSKEVEFVHNVTLRVVKPSNRLFKVLNPVK